MNNLYSASALLGVLFLAGNPASAAQYPIIAHQEFTQGSVKIEAHSHLESSPLNVADPLTEMQSTAFIPQIAD